MTHCSNGHLAQRAIEKDRKLNPKPVKMTPQKDFRSKVIDFVLRFVKKRK
jgi:hypothetical protein